MHPFILESHILASFVQDANVIDEKFGVKFGVSGYVGLELTIAAHVWMSMPLWILLDLCVWWGEIAFQGANIIHHEISSKSDF